MRRTRPSSWVPTVSRVHSGDRSAAAKFVARRLGTPPSPERLIITNSSQVALLNLIVTIVGTTGKIAVDEVAYPFISQLSKHLGFRVIPVPIDDEGMVPAALRNVCRSDSPQVLYSTPTLQNPTTGVMSLERRREIASIADEHDLVIIEDDIYSLLPSDQPPALSTRTRAVLVHSWYDQRRSRGTEDMFRGRTVERRGR